MGYLTSIQTRIGLSVCLFLVAIAVYYPALDVRPVADDFHIVDQIHFDDAFRYLSDTFGFGRNEYRPVAAFSFALSNSIWQGDHRGYHLESILLHALNSVLLFSWLYLLTGTTLIPGLAGLLFAVHPIHHSRVIWISARESLLSSAFLLAALITYTLAREAPHVQARHSGRKAIALAILSLLFFSLGLLSYEGAVVLPGILLGMEFFLFTPKPETLWNRLRIALLRTLPYLGVLLVYLTFWIFLFRGQVGHYDLSYTVGNFVKNYHSLLYQLLHGHQYLAGVLYLVPLLLGLSLPRERRRFLWFSLFLIFVSFLPFSMITGFASRFAYKSTIGYALLVALLLCAGIFRPGMGSALRPANPRLLIAAATFVLVFGYYASDVRGRIPDWKIAGEIADCIPKRVKSIYPDLPDGSTLVLARIPKMHGRAYVYPLGLRYSILRLYPGRDLRVFYGSDELDRILEARNIERNPHAFFFQYVPDQKCLEEIEGRRQSAGEVIRD
jgi:MFS family permease